MTVLFLADNAIADNSPRTISFENEDGEEVVFSVSQHRSPSKPEGQDAIASHVNGRWQCVVVCDGHDVHGHLAARGICEELSLYLLEVLASREEEEGEGFRLDDDAQAEQAILHAFEETERRVMWSNALLHPNCFVRIIDGEHRDKVGFISEVHDLDDTFTVIVVDSDDYHRPRVPRQFLMGARFVGGATCCCFVRDSIANLCRVAVMGDTRCMVINAPQDGVLLADRIFERLPDTNNNTFVTFPHDVYNTAELARLQEEWDGEHEIDGCYLVNPLTGCEIQPTRGFGDFDMFGTGYISVPDVSVAFSLRPDTVVILGTDGLFDMMAWKDDLQYMADFCHARAQGDIASLGEMLHLETVRRSELTSGYVDDVAFFMCRHVPRAGTAAASPRASQLSALGGGVDGLPAAAVAAVASTGILSHQGSFVVPRLSASLSEIAVNRRISHALTNPGAVHDIDSLLQLANTSSSPPHTPTNRPPPSPRNAAAAAGTTPPSFKHLKRHSTADFINPNAPRYIKHSIVQKEDTVRRTRGPSFMLPDGFDIPTSTAQAAADEEDAHHHRRSSCGPAMDLARIGEDVEYNDGTSPADSIRHVIASKRRSVAAANAANAASVDIPYSSSSSHLLPRPSVNTILQRMAARYGHDPKILQEIAKDLNIV